MPGRFEGKTVFITGASSGIGAALATVYAREGANVAVAARRTEKLQALVDSFGSDSRKGVAVSCDVTDRASIDAAVERTVAAFGGIDIAIANAGFGVSGVFQQLTTDDYRRQFDTNVFGAIDTAYAVYPHLVKSRGRFAVVSSVLGKFGRATMSAYAASKFALCGWCEAAAPEFAAEGVSLTCINPGLIESDFRMTDNRAEFHPDREDTAPQFLVMPAAKAARHIMRAIDKRKREATITMHGKAVVFVSRHFPGAFHRLLDIASKKRVLRHVEAAGSPESDS